jgi:flagellar biosynthesis/type III secretory pathway protein FliH
VVVVRHDGPWRPPDIGELPAAAAPPEADPAGDYASGYAAGLRDGESRRTDLLREAGDRLAAMLAPLREAWQAAAADRVDDLVALSLAVSRHLLQREITSDPTLVADLARRAVALIPDSAPLVVRLHTADLDALHELFASGVEPPGGRTVRWEADPLLERGDIVVEGPQRLVDGRTDAALRGIYERLAHA